VFREGIRALYGQFSPGYRRIADYLLNHYQDAAFMTAAEIARIVDVDTALVVRFAQRLGYPGFPELINEVQEEVKRDLRAVYEPPEGDNSPAQIYRRNLMQDRNNLDYSLLHFEAETVECVVKVLKEAKRIFVAGEGNLTYLSEAFAARLVGLGYAAHPVSQELAGQASMSVTLSPDDAVLCIGMTAMTPGVAVMLKVAKDLGAKTVAIAGSATNSIASVAQYVLYAPVATVGLLPSWTAAAASLHALSQALALADPERGSIWAEHNDRFLRVYSDTLRDQLSDVQTTLKQLAPHNGDR
jgi:DNA-binding MurR/RpiR family transcriptional regulator